MTKLSHDNARYGNNLLANFVTDGISDNLKKYYPDVEVLGIQGHMFRQSLPLNKKVNNLEIIDVLNGCIENFSEMYTGKLKGLELKDIIIEYVKNNAENKDRNAIIQWSGVQVNKPKLLNAVNHNDMAGIKESIKIKNKQGIYNSINFDQTYSTALPKELFVIPNLSATINLKNKFSPTNLTMNKLFKEYLKDKNCKVNVLNSNDVRVIE
jgi:hypothetical protein